MKRKFKLYIGAGIFGILCAFLGKSITAIIIVASGFYNQWFFSIFSMIFAFTIFFKYHKKVINFFIKK